MARYQDIACWWMLDQRCPCNSYAACFHARNAGGTEHLITNFEPNGCRHLWRFCPWSKLQSLTDVWRSDSASPGKLCIAPWPVKGMFGLVVLSSVRRRVNWVKAWRRRCDAGEAEALSYVLEDRNHVTCSSWSTWICWGVDSPSWGAPCC